MGELKRLVSLLQFTRLLFRTSNGTEQYESAIASVHDHVVDRLQSIKVIVAIASLDEIERELSQWYGDRRLAM